MAERGGVQSRPAEGKDTPRTLRPSATKWEQTGRGACRGRGRPKDGEVEGCRAWTWPRTWPRRSPVTLADRVLVATEAEMGSKAAGRMGKEGMGSRPVWAVEERPQRAAGGGGWRQGRLGLFSFRVGPTGHVGC